MHKGVSNMSDYNYEVIKTSIWEWYERVLSDCLNQDEIMLSKNNEEALIIDFDFKNCMAQLSVTNSQYVPYQFVYFEAMDIGTSDLEEIIPIYSFHDDVPIFLHSIRFLNVRYAPLFPSHVLNNMHSSFS